LPIQLSPRERSALRARGHALDPVVMVGDGGLTPAVMREIDASLKAHELIKIRVAGDDRAFREDILRQVCAELAAAPVQHIGKILLIYRHSPEATPREPAARPRRKPARPLKRSFQNRP
jgi:putative YhbY family RNA-binding protein